MSVIGASENNWNNVKLENGAQLFGQIVGTHFILETQIEIVFRQKTFETILPRTFVAFECAATSVNVYPDILFPTQSVDEFFSFAGGVAVADEPNDFDHFVAFDGRVVGNLSV